MQVWFYGKRPNRCLHRLIHRLISTAPKGQVNYLAFYRQTKNLPGLLPRFCFRPITNQDRPCPNSLQSVRQEYLLFAFGMGNYREIVQLETVLHELRLSNFRSLDAIYENLS